MKKREGTKRTISIILILLVILIVLFLLFIFSGRETHISKDNKDKEAYLALDCEASGLDGQFFASQTVNSITNRIKVTFNKDMVDKLFYSFEGVYKLEEIAEQDEAVLHARYNIYMSKYNINPEIFTPTFSTVNTKMRINLYVKDRELINEGTGVLFFIDKEDVGEFLEYSREQVSDYYEKKGFSCKKQN